MFDVSADGYRSVERLSTRTIHRRTALFLDRDGVLVHDDGYVGDITRIRLIDGVFDVVADCWRAGIAVIIVTNQSGVSRTKYTWADASAVNNVIAQVAREHGGGIDLVLACSALPLSAHPWRKPAPGMIDFAVEEFGVDRPSSWIVGDRMSDIEAGLAADLKGQVLVDPGSSSSGFVEGLKAVSTASEAVGLARDELLHRSNRPKQ